MRHIRLLLCNQQRLVNNMDLDTSRIIRPLSPKEKRGRNGKEKEKERECKVQNI